MNKAQATTLVLSLALGCTSMPVSKSHMDCQTEWIETVKKQLDRKLPDSWKTHAIALVSDGGDYQKRTEDEIDRAFMHAYAPLTIRVEGKNEQKIYVAQGARPVSTQEVDDGIDYQSPSIVLPRPERHSGFACDGQVFIRVIAADLRPAVTQVKLASAAAADLSHIEDTVRKERWLPLAGSTPWFHGIHRDGKPILKDATSFPVDRRATGDALLPGMLCQRQTGKGPSTEWILALSADEVAYVSGGGIATGPLDLALPGRLACYWATESIKEFERLRGNAQ
jgi:hypothetical protein